MVQGHCGAERENGLQPGLSQPCGHQRRDLFAGRQQLCQQGHQQQLCGDSRGGSGDHDPARGQGIGFGIKLHVECDRLWLLPALLLEPDWTNTNTCSLGSDTNKLTITGAEYTNAGTYSVIVSNLAASVTSSVANITVQQTAGFTLQPSLTNIWPTNSQQTLSATASGDGLAYQWYKGTAALSGKTASSLVFPSLVATNAGTYSLVISNYAGKLTSSNFVVIPVVAPVITAQPAGKGLVLGSNYTMSVTATGPYLHYYWSQIETNYTNQAWQDTAWEDVTNLVGGDTNKLTITGAAYTNAGLYTVIVSNVAGIVTSSNASLDVLAQPKIEYQTGGATNAVGDNIYLWAIAGGDISGASVTRTAKRLRTEMA